MVFQQLVEFRSFYSSVVWQKLEKENGVKGLWRICCSHTTILP